jgi:hypothetical protein
MSGQKSHPTSGCCANIRLFSVDVNARGRLNTTFVTSNFIGGAIGSMLAEVLWRFSMTLG